MSFYGIAGAACRALTARKDGPSLYDLCDPLLLSPKSGDAHLSKFYRTAIGNPALRALLRRTGLPELVDGQLVSLREALIHARDAASPDWERVGAPVAALLDGIKLSHPSPKPAKPNGAAPKPSEIDQLIKTCATHLLGSFRKNGFIPAYAAFNLIGDADVRGRELTMALTGLNSRGYKNSTLLFNLARVFIARSEARILINPPWTGIAEPLWEPMQIRHRSAYYDAFFTEALLAYCRQHLHDAELSPQRAADHLGISLRTLHSRFRQIGQSFSRWVLEHRLEACRAALRDENQRALHISEIAYRWGFNDLSHFNKVFRARFDMSPRDWRNGSDAGDDPPLVPLTAD